MLGHFEVTGFVRLLDRRQNYLVSLVSGHEAEEAKLVATMTDGNEREADTMCYIAAMLPATIARATSTIARPLCLRRAASTSTTAASASVPAASGAAAAFGRRRAAASASATSAAAAARHLSSSSPTANSATASTATHTQNSSSANPEGLSTLGTLFFGGLCAATFGLGCWQSARYFEKVDQMQVREDELRAPPVDMTRFTTATGTSNDSNGSNGDDNSNSAGSKQGSSSSPSSSFRRLVTRGTFDHGREVLVGPRGPPPGALSSTGPSSGRSSGGMSSSPQGYYVVTPLRIVAATSTGVDGDNNNTILVNRGWVPMSYVKQQNAAAGTWSRPRGVVTVVGVETVTEKPKFLSPVHDQRTPNRLLWMDRGALEERTGTGAGTGKGKGKGAGGDGGDGQHRHPLLLTETAETAETADDSTADGSPDAPPLAPPTPPTFPVRPTAETVGEFKVTPATHAGYAVTWFGLSGAGMIMTRKLLTRGR